MNLENNNSNIEKVNWKYFPNVCQLSKFLPRSDLIQLSLTCSQFRTKLNPKLFSKLELMKGGFIQGKSDKSSKKQIVPLFDILEEGYLDRYNIVKHCIIWEFFDGILAKNFFNLFTNITKLELYTKYTYNYTDILFINKTIGSNAVLIDALYPLKNLESLKICSRLINTYESYSNTYLKLPLSLKILLVIQCKYCDRDLNFYPIVNINEEYSNLKQVSIINNKMLNNMMVRMKSLVDVTISNQENLSTYALIQFLLLNRQLEKLSIPNQFMEYKLANSILKMQQLKHLHIRHSLYGDLDPINNLPVNTSIEHLNISCYISSNRLVSILNSLKSLKVLEFSNCSLYNFMKLNFSTYTNRIPLLHLNNLDYEDYNIAMFDNPKIFDRIRLTNLFDLDYYLNNYQGDSLEDWDVFHLDPANTREFTVIKKT